MEILHLSSTQPSSGAPAELNMDNGANGVPGFALVPTQRLPVRRLFQGLATDFILFLAAIVLAWLLPTSGRQGAALKTDASPYKHTPIFLQGPPPVRKRSPGVALPRVKIAAIRRFATPQATVKRGVSPRVEPAPVVADTPPERAPRILAKGIPVPPTPVLAILRVSAGSLKAPVALPILDPGPLRASASPQRGTSAGRDLLGSVDRTARSFGPGSGGEEASGGPADISARPLRDANGDRSRQRIGFIKPQISFMPKPTYPSTALAARIEGDVSLEVTFDKSGHIIFRRFIRPLENAELNAIAREAVERIKFVPAMRNGIPEDQDSVVTVFFRVTRLNMSAEF